MEWLRVRQDGDATTLERTLGVIEPNTIILLGGASQEVPTYDIDGYSQTSSS